MIHVDTHLRGNVCIKANERFTFLTRSYLFTQSFTLFVCLFDIIPFLLRVICAWTVHNLGFEKLLISTVKAEVMPCKNRKWTRRKQNLLKGKAFGSDLSILQYVLGFIQCSLLHYCVAGGRGLQHQGCSSTVGTSRLGPE